MPAVVVLAALPASVRAASLSEARTLFDTGKYAECIAMCAEGSAAQTWQESWWLLKIDAEMAIGQYAEGLSTLQAGLKAFPSSIQLRWSGHRVQLVNGRRVEAGQMLEEIGGLIRESRWRYGNAADQITQGRYFLLLGADARQVLEAFYDPVGKRQPAFAPTHLATGELALDKHDYALAAQAYERATELTPDDPSVHLGLARAYEASDPGAAKAALAKALARNPQHAESLLMMADSLIDAERYDEAKTILDQVLEVNPKNAEACAYRAVLAHLAGDSAGEKQWRDRALSSWSANPAVDYLIGRKLSQDYRFAEGAAYQRRALQFAPDYVPARIQLSQDLLRLGEEAEGWRLAEEACRKDGYHVVAHNLVTLQETLGKFKTLKSDGFLLRMDALEADLYGEAALELLQEARRVLCAKYDVRLDETVAVEIFPEQKDFAVRTFGMPGGAGFLGVCFGRLITANSPSSQGASPSNWKAVLWHEFCHAVTLHKTKNKMPRWLSEGISVYEERQANPSWGDSMDATYRKMVLDGELTPVSQLSGAFLQPPTPLHLQFAYFESSLVVEYLVEKHGLEALKRILDDLAADTTIDTALQRHIASSEELDKQFAAYARQRAEGLASGADWAVPELPPEADVTAIEDWNRRHSNNLAGLRLLAAAYLKQQQWQKAKTPLAELIRLYPEDTSADNAYRLLARVHQELGEADAELVALEQLAGRDGDVVDVYRRLAEMYEQAENWEGVARNAQRILAVNPLLTAPHRQLARAAERLGQPQQAIGSYRALLRMQPTDLAETHYRLARLLKEQGDVTAARRQVLMALEEAPRFRAAHRLLLELVDRDAAEPAKVASGPAGQEAKP